MLCTFLITPFLVDILVSEKAIVLREFDDQHGQADTTVFNMRAALNKSVLDVHLYVRLLFLSELEILLFLKGSSSIKLVFLALNRLLSLKLTLHMS